MYALTCRAKKSICTKRETSYSVHLLQDNRTGTMSGEKAVEYQLENYVC